MIGLRPNKKHPSYAVYTLLDNPDLWLQDSWRPKVIYIGREYNPEITVKYGLFSFDIIIGGVESNGYRLTDVKVKVPWRYRRAFRKKCKKLVQAQSKRVQDDARKTAEKMRETTQ